MTHWYNFISATRGKDDSFFIVRMIRLSSASMICFFYQFLQSRPDLSRHHFIVGQFFSHVYKEYRQELFFSSKMFLQRVFLQTIGLPRQSFDTVAIDRFFKIPVTRAESRLQEDPGGWQVAGQIEHPEWEEGKAFPFPEHPFNELTAFQPFFFPECEFWGADKNLFYAWYCKIKKGTVSKIKKLRGALYAVFCPGKSTRPWAGTPGFISV